MRKFNITKKMLGPREVITILKAPLQDNVLNLMKEEYEVDALSRKILDNFLAPLSIVRSSLKKNSIGMLASISVHHAIKMSEELPPKAQRLLGPQVESLLEIAPQIDLLVAGKEFMERFVFPYPEGCDNPEIILEGAGRFLDTLKASMAVMTERGFQATAGLFGDALMKEKERIFFEKSFLRSRLPKRLDGNSMIVKDALDAVLGVIRG